VPYPTVGIVEQIIEIGPKE